MGNSLSMINPAHVRIYQNIIKINNPHTRVQMIETVLNGQEFVSSAKHAGVYPHLLSYITYYRRGVQPPVLPGEPGYNPGSSFVSGADARQDPGIYTQQTPGTTTHPSLMNRPHQPQQSQQSQQQIQEYQEQPQNPYAQIVRAPEKKALSYFNSCLEVLGLTEDMSLTLEVLKAAYKKAAVKAHPDKAGGSEEKFQAITKAYAYLAEILKRITGSRSEAMAPQQIDPLKDSRQTEAEQWKHVEPVRLDPKNLNLNTFNQMYEQTRLPDPDGDGYGDWLKEEGGASASSQKFGGKFNRDVFNSVFERDATAGRQQQHQQQIQLVHPQSMALTLAPSSGVEIGRDKPADFTAPANAQMHYTDLRKAYTTESTFSGQVSHIQIDSRDMKSYKAERDKGPAPMSANEAALIAAQEAEYVAQEKARQMRAAHQSTLDEQYFQRMKQLVLTNSSSK
jgi:curved DNA-binding protein CbpA